MGQKINWNVKKSADGQGWVGVVELPAGLAFGAKDSTRRGAASKAASLASSALENPLVQSLLPPGAGLALKALKSDVGKKLLGGLKSFF